LTDGRRTKSDDNKNTRNSLKCAVCEKWNVEEKFTTSLK
jgi:hypothetical protein